MDNTEQGIDFAMKMIDVSHWLSDKCVLNAMTDVIEIQNYAEERLARAKGFILATTPISGGQIWLTYVVADDGDAPRWWYFQRTARNVADGIAYRNLGKKVGRLSELLVERLNRCLMTTMDDEVVVDELDENLEKDLVVVENILEQRDSAQKTLGEVLGHLGESEEGWSRCSGQRIHLQSDLEIARAEVSRLESINKSLSNELALCAANLRQANKSWFDGLKSVVLALWNW